MLLQSIKKKQKTSDVLLKTYSCNNYTSGDWRYGREYFNLRGSIDDAIEYYNRNNNVVIFNCTRVRLHMRNDNWGTLYHKYRYQDYNPSRNSGFTTNNYTRWYNYSLNIDYINNGYDWSIEVQDDSRYSGSSTVYMYGDIEYYEL